MRSNKGIALMMVISAIMLLSMIILEFVYSSNVTYRLAINERERLQAYYLAESALNLMKMELKIDKQMRSAISSSPVAQYVTANLNEPICQQFPFSTGLLRTFFIGGELPLFGGSKEKGAEKGAEEVPKEEKGKSVTTFETEKAQEFLSFDGDFEGTCADEQTKFNLNVFATLDPTQQTLSGTNPYDLYKITLVNLLKSERYKKLFDEASPEKINDVVRNIADWVDKNDVMNDLGNISRGSEESLYKGDIPKPKNARFLSLDELHLVEGVDDKWFLPLEDLFTVYGDSRVNVCVASDDVVWALILTYASQNPNIPPINPKNDEIKKKLIDTIKFSCSGTQPQPAKIAADLDIVLAGGVVANPAEQQGQTQNPQSNPQTNPSQQPSGNFASMITTESRFFSLKLTGQVGDTMVNVKTVLDVRDADPKRWKVLYYKIF